MARQKPRKAFPVETKRRNFETRSNDVNQTYINTERSGFYGFLSDRGVRETIESVIVAIVLALVFRAYEAEAFVIPTGSMAFSLQGQHRDIYCEQCNYLYQTGASEESSSYPPQLRNHVEKTFCPICQYRTKMKTTNPDHQSNNGDRILVNKFVYDFSEPERFDVIVFKNPNNGKQNFIKRLIGLPGDQIVIENGDLFQYNKNDDKTDSRTIIRKPNKKLDIMMQLVDDTDYIPQKMHDAGWPLRWQQWDRTEAASDWSSIVESANPLYEVSADDETKWLRYRHLIPISRQPPSDPPENDVNGRRITPREEQIYEWDDIELGELPKRLDPKDPKGRLISDYYCYNHRILKNANGSNANYVQSYGVHWVGDVATEFWCEVKGEQGKIILEAVEGGVKYNCTIDVQTGKATLSTDSKNVQFVDAQSNIVEAPTGSSDLSGAGEYCIFFGNVDDEIRLSINKKFVEFDAATFVRSDNVMPTSFPGDPSNMGDGEPISIGAKNVSMEISRLKILRDIYYSSPKDLNKNYIDNETGVSNKQIEKVWRWFDDPELWGSPSAVAYFSSRFRAKPYVYKLGEDQFLPMGDNSPSSLDGRIWDGPKFVSRDMLIGRALFIYWPHSLNSPIKYFPNFKKMKFIR